MSLKINKIFTENAYVDELVYYTKILGLDTILKNQTDADNAETLESLKAGELYILSYEGTVEFWRFSEDLLKKYITADVLKEYCNITNDKIIQSYVDEPEALPDQYRKLILPYLRERYLNDYEELNSYYRMLQGKPPIDQEGIYIKDYYVDTTGLVDMTKMFHELTDSEVKLLDSAGILDRVYNEDPENRAYILFLTRRVYSYQARKAVAFEPIYVPQIDSTAIREMYIDKLEQNRTYTLATIYSDAYKYNSDYYDNFICVFIVLITMIDIISRVQEFITRKEIFDIRSCEYLFQSFGVPFFEEIPLRYQINMVKNIHTLLKYKSSAKCMVDIATLFGFNNIKIFKYYLLKDRRVKADGEYTFNYDKNGDGNNDEDFELKFLKLPLEGQLDEYIRSGSNHIDYDQITLSDPTWDGGLDHDQVRKDILKEEFNYSRTKYISIDTVYDITKIAMQQAYFFNILYDNNYLEDLIKVNIPFIDPAIDFKVADIFTLLTILTYTFKGVKDMIMDTQSKILYVHGFNFKADLGELSAYLKKTADNLIKDGYIVDSINDVHDTLKSFMIPDGPFPSFNQMMDLFVNNMKIRDIIIAGMEHADNLRIYLIFKKLYDSLMTIELTMDYYKNPDTNDFYRDIDGDATYTEFLKHKEPRLYGILVELEAFEDDKSRNQYIANLIDSIVYVLEEYIDTKEFNGIFSNLPVTSSEAVKKYIATVINFYKSFKVDFLGLNTVYYLDDKLDGIIKIIDDIMEIRPNYTEKDYVKLYDFVKMMINMTEDEHIDLQIREQIMMNITWFAQVWLRDKYFPEEKIMDMRINITKEDYLQFMELNNISRYNIYDDHDFKILDIIPSIMINLCLKDKISLIDTSIINRNYIIGENDCIIIGNDPNELVYFEIPYVDATDALCIVEDYRIKENYNGQFIPNENISNYIESYEAICLDRRCAVHVSYNTFGENIPIIGRLIIKDTI